MWEEATVSRLRSGAVRRRGRATPTASTAEPCPHDAGCEYAPRPRAATRDEPPHRRSLADLHPPPLRRSRSPSASRAGCTVAAPGIEGAAAEGRRGAALGHLLGRKRLNRVADAKLLAGGKGISPNAIMRPSG